MISFILGFTLGFTIMAIVKVGGRDEWWNRRNITYLESKGE